MDYRKEVREEEDKEENIEEEGRSRRRQIKLGGERKENGEVSKAG